MNWGSFSAFLAMGGYAEYIWGSYVVTAVCVVAEICMVRSRARKARSHLPGR
jgi:heme exporter protein D